MKVEAAFGRCLNELLMARGWSAARLAREMNLDPSYIRRWIRGSRVPSVKSDYIDRIVHSLCDGIDNGSSRNLKNNYIIALKELDIEIDYNKSISEILTDALAQSQICSLKISSDERMQKSATTEDDIVSLLEKIGKETRHERSIPMSSHVDSINSMPGIIKGRETILSGYISLLKAAQNRNDVKGGDIIITFQSESHPFDGYSKLEELWQSELDGVLTDGWKVKHLLKLNKNVNRSIKLVKRILQQVGFNRQYQPFYYEKYGTLDPAAEVMIVEGIGALVGFSTEDRGYIDTAFFYAQAEAVQSLYKHYSQVFLNFQPLLEVLTIDDYFKFNTESDKKQGDRFIIRNDLDSLTIPNSLWHRYLRRTFIDGADIEPHMNRIKTRLDSFYKQVQRYRFMNICSIEAVEHLVKNGEYLYDNVYRVPENDDIMEHLENIIYLLKTYKNFEIGLLSENQANLLPPAFWEVKGDYSVIIDMWHPRESRNEPDESGLFLAITEGTISGSFRDYFLDLWDRITPKYRDKEFVIKWFEEQLDWFKKEHSKKIGEFS